MHDFDTHCESALVAPGAEDLLTHLVTIDVSDDSVAITVSELDRERLKGVTFRDVVLDSMLEFNSSKVTSTDTFEFVVS